MALKITTYSHPSDENPLEHEGIDYVSLVNNGTHGKPALIAPGGKPGDPRATVGETVLYINTAFVPMFEIERVSG